MAGSVGISNRKSMSNLADSVSIRVSLSLTLAIVSSISISKASIAIGNWGSNSMSSIAKMSNTSISGISRGGVSGTGDYSNIVRMAGSVGISDRKSMGNLADSVSIRVSLSLTLAVVSSISQTTISISNRGGYSMSSIGTVTNGTKSLHKTIAIVHTSYNTAIGVSR